MSGTKLIYMGALRYGIDYTNPYIERLSPMFCSILAQSREAEYHGLDLIAGAGYGKALEFLVKDYIIKEGKQNPEVYRKADLYDCINGNLSDKGKENPLQKIMNTVNIARIIRNNEIHYETNYKKEKNDMRKIEQILNAVVGYIIAENKALDFKPVKKKGAK